MSSPYRFVDASGAAAREQDKWRATVVPREAIDLEIERLADIVRPANGRRASLIVHPSAVSPGLGLAPGIDVTINVLKPGETTVPLRRNSTMVEMCIAGQGVATVAGRDIRVAQFDVWNTPAMQVHAYRNDGPGLMVRLSYSNAPLLEKLEVHYVEEDPRPAARQPAARPAGAVRSRDLAGKLQLTEEGAWLLGYEYLIDIDVTESKALHWPWKLVEEHLPSVLDLSPGYNGRRLYCLYNPATGLRNGTTHSFFATLSCSPPGNRHVPHRHSSSAINYYFRGHGHSVVDGERHDWKSGDLMLSAPGWAAHCHFTGTEATSALTIQDHPLQIAMESLIWQERMNEPIRSLGSEAGFDSNRADLAQVP